MRLCRFSVVGFFKDLLRSLGSGLGSAPFLRSEAVFSCTLAAKVGWAISRERALRTHKKAKLIGTNAVQAVVIYGQVA